MSNPQALHATVLSSFPPDSLRTHAGGLKRVLWRLDSSPTRDDLYVVSPVQPDFTGLVEEAGWPTQETWRTREYSSRLENLKAGQEWRFRLVANPTVAKLDPAGGRSKRIAHVTPAQQLLWLLDKASKSGFEIRETQDLPIVGDKPSYEVQVSRSQVRKFQRKSRTVTLKIVQFDGTLRVTDPEQLGAMLVNGIGPAKGYGCGLLTLAPLAEF